MGTTSPHISTVARAVLCGACVCVVLCFSALAARADEPPACPDPCAAPSEGLLPVPEYGGCWYQRPKLTGDWCGVRDRWARKGVQFDLQWTQVAQGVVDGGTREHWAHTTNLDLYAYLDLMRMGFIPGALVTIRAQSRFGETVNTDSGLLLPVHTYGYFPFTDVPDEDVPIAITELNWTQMVSEKLGFLFGKITTMTVSNEFAGGAGRSQFMNFQFLFPSAFAQIGPYSTLAAGVVWIPSPHVSVTSLLLNTTDSSTTTGFDDFDAGQTWWTNVDFKYRLGSKPGGATLGVGYAYRGDFARIGGLNIDPSGGVSLDTTSDTWAAFVTAWQYLFTLEPVRDVDPADGRQDLRGLGAFAILGLGDEDANPVQWSLAVGLGGRALIPGRCDDTCGVGYFYNGLGEPIAESDLGRLLEDDVQGIEAYYQIALTGSVGLTLDAQWTDSSVRGVQDAFLLAVRLNVDF